MGELTQGEEKNQNQQDQKNDTEKVADLGRIMSMAEDEPDYVKDLAKKDEQEKQVIALGLAEEIEAAIDLVVSLTSPIFPSIRGVYGPATNKAVGASVAALCAKHGWLQGGLMAGYAEELACFAIVAPVAYGTVKAVKTDLAQMQKTVKNEDEKPVTERAAEKLMEVRV
jgi:hypothetical protein